MLMRRLLYAVKRNPAAVAGRMRLLYGLELIQTFMADVFALKAYKVIRVITEKTSGMVLFQYDGFFVHEDFDGVLDINAQGPAEFDRDDHPTERIHFSNDARRFHVVILSIS